MMKKRRKEKKRTRRKFAVVLVGFTEPRFVAYRSMQKMVRLGATGEFKAYLIV
jgi:hypothetical protein